MLKSLLYLGLAGAGGYAAYKYAEKNSPQTLCKIGFKSKCSVAVPNTGTTNPTPPIVIPSTEAIKKQL